MLFSFLAIAARLEESGEPIQKALGDPGLVRYWRNWGRDGDTGVVADSASYPLGCGWVRLFPPEHPGYGFAEEGVPELGLGVIAAARGRGVGTRILERLLERCRERFPAVSLSVRDTNPARRLYERFGFRPVEGGARPNPYGSLSITMMRRFE